MTNESKFKSKEILSKQKRIFSGFIDNLENKNYDYRTIKIIGFQLQ